MDKEDSILVGSSILAGIVCLWGAFGILHYVGTLYPPDWTFFPTVMSVLGGAVYIFFVLIGKLEKFFTRII